jgi:uncharacterized protein (DUF58 family)
MKLLTRELLAKLHSLQIPSHSRHRTSHRGEKSSLRKGSSLEFSDYREYLQGDDIRSIDWNVYARSERLFLKLFLEEEGKPVYLIVDCSNSMNFGEPTKFDYAIALAASLCFISLRHFDRPQVLLLQDRNFEKISFRSQKQFFPLLNEFEKKKTSGQTHLSAALKKIALAGYTRGIYFIISDFYSYDGFEGLKILAAAGNELHCLQVLSPEELNPEIRGDLKLVDSETSESSEVSVSPLILKKYLARLSGLQEEIKQTAHRSFASFYPISSAEPLASLLLRSLKSRGILN